MVQWEFGPFHFLFQSNLKDCSLSYFLYVVAVEILISTKLNQIIESRKYRNTSLHNFCWKKALPKSYHQINKPMVLPLKLSTWNNLTLKNKSNEGIRFSKHLKNYFHPNMLFLLSAINNRHLRKEKKELTNLSGLESRMN